jgi:hypothetical protein
VRARYSATLHHLTLPTRNAFRQAQGNAFTGQYSYVSDDATDLGSSGFGLMFYREASRAVLWRVDNARWLRSVPEMEWRGYDPALGRMAQADSIVPGGVQGA